MVNLDHWLHGRMSKCLDSELVGTSTGADPNTTTFKECTQSLVQAREQERREMNMAFEFLRLRSKSFSFVPMRSQTTDLTISGNVKYHRTTNTSEGKTEPGAVEGRRVSPTGHSCFRIFEVGEELLRKLLMFSDELSRTGQQVS